MTTRFESIKKTSQYLIAPLAAMALFTALYIGSDRTLPLATIPLVTLVAALQLPTFEVFLIALVNSLLSVTLVLTSGAVGTPYGSRIGVLLAINFLAVVVANQRSEIRARHGNLKVSKEFSSSLLAADKSQDLTRALVSGLSELFSTDIAAVARITPSDAGLRIVGSSADGPISILSSPAIYFLSLHALNIDDIVVYKDPKALTKIVGEECGAMEMRVGCVLPLYQTTGKKKVLILLWKNRSPLKPHEIETLRSVCTTASQVYERDRVLEQQRTISSTLQHRLLNIDEPRGACNVATRYLPAVKELEVGGDWFDVVQLDRDHIALIVGDTVGKGLPASATMSQLRSALSAMTTVNDSPAEVLRKLDKFAARVEGALAATAVVAIVQLSTGIIRMSSAGHPPPIIVKTDGSRELCDENAQWPIGAVTDGSRTESEAKIETGDTLLLYTDGLVEQRNEIIDIGIQRVAVNAVALRTKPLEQFCDELLLKITSKKSRRDDVVLVAFRMLEEEVPRFKTEFSALQGSMSDFRNELEKWLDSVNIDKSARNDLLLASSEAIANSIEHSGVTESSGRLAVKAAKESGSLFISIADYGKWDPSPPKAGRGRGLNFIRSVMDSVSIDSSTSGTIVRMIKNP
jgi:anti-sigma regulatory factor (Ser/Thr protein kinase)